MRFRSIGFLAGVFAASGWCQNPAKPDLLIADPQHYRLEFENQWVRVIREKMGPHETALPHRHPEPGGVVVFLTDQHLLQTGEDGVPREARHKAGDVIWSPGRTHKGQNLDDSVFEYVEIEPRPRADGAVAAPAGENRLEAAVVDPGHYRVEFENDLVRVIRFAMTPHDKTAVHTHPPTGAVIVALTDQNTRQTVAGGATRDIRHKAGEAWWGAPNTAHQDENASDQPSTVIRIELKQAR